MKAHTTKVSPRPVRMRTSKKQADAVLATCPLNGAGWCPYPFTAEQLQRRLREKAATPASATAKALPAGKPAVASARTKARSVR